jgi:hypothetical protein
VRLRHSGCGEIVHAELRCAAGHPVTDSELDLTVGPGRLARQERMAKTGSQG